MELGVSVSKNWITSTPGASSGISTTARAEFDDGGTREMSTRERDAVGVVGRSGWVGA